MITYFNLKTKLETDYKRQGLLYSRHVSEVLVKMTVKYNNLATMRDVIQKMRMI